MLCAIFEVQALLWPTSDDRSWRDRRRAFAPFLVAIFLVTKHYAKPKTRKAFLTNLEIPWILTLLLACLTFMTSLEL